MIPFLCLIFFAALMLAVLPDRKTGRDGLYLVILWLSQAVRLTSKALFAVAEGYARMRAGMVAAVAAGRQETARAYREAYDA